ncbi:hypothetical protein H9655_00320 [Cytobacillus sp. Sa5YUA1]|uniref:Uncharacterized protein n=1 Tax=Cytobacillus stercorigallinarum TaxID=2762240 RepID=A0ABR8QJ54_9BACI|nr:hypothetical protein [Cytobacillus stercorigallinarum]MBD7935459.1 hypothetical protein [Cytobacillus stercorigallinarum]
MKKYHKTVSEHRIGFQTKTAENAREIIVYDHEIIALHFKNKKPTYYKVLNKEALTSIIDTLTSKK